jgi:hypothetical protein
VTRAKDIGPNGSRSWRERLYRKERLAALGFTTGQYADYLETPHWKQFRRAAFEDQRKRQGRNLCELCGASDVKLIVHHLTYERLGAELLSDGRIICRTCHDNIIHGRGSGVAPEVIDYCPWRQVDPNKRVAVRRENAQKVPSK